MQRPRNKRLGKFELKLRRVSMADPNQPSSSSPPVIKRKGTRDQELEYLKLVRDKFGSGDNIRYPGFFGVMKGYNKGKYDTLEIISFARAFFEGHDELLTGFNILLPKGYSIDSVAPKMDLPKELRDIVENIALMHKVKTQLQNDKPCYNSFLDLLNKYRRNLCSFQIVYNKLPIIFQDYPDLLAELQIYFSKEE